MLPCPAVWRRSQSPCVLSCQPRSEAAIYQPEDAHGHEYDNENHGRRRNDRLVLLRHAEVLGDEAHHEGADDGPCETVEEPTDDHVHHYVDRAAETECGGHYRRAVSDKEAAGDG